MVKSQFHDRPEVYNQFLEIMKEFKSHAIDTPGVINRVSRLFHGSPALIQGFNTFLPPGYRIECSDDPSEGVRVTTPSGSIIPDMHRQASSVSLQGPPQSPAPASSQPAAQRSQHQQPYASRDQYAARRAAQGGQSAQTALQSAAAEANGQLGTAYAGSAAATAAASATAHSPGAMRSPSIPASQRSRGVPVEFNHAITYVNKIKMRFAAEPDRYKEFLEILQTYQKESRPIHEVYGQVQHLFSSAPDLLDEFKQFLPDTSEAGAGASALTGVGSPPTAYARPGAGAGAAAGGGMAQGQYAHGGVVPPHGMGAADAIAGGRLPPVGNFAPASGHSGDPFSGGTGGVGTAPGAGGGYDGKVSGATPTGSRKRRGVMAAGAQVPGAAPTKRRTKGTKADGTSADVPPGYGSPMPQHGYAQQAANPATATSDELAFFERVKRFIGQPNAYNEFLKLLNLYNQQVIDPKTLVERAESFIGDDHELFGWFKQFVGFDDQQQEMDDARSGDEEIIESLLGPEPTAYIPPEEAIKMLRPPRPKVNLVQCKAYGPSYRLLPDAATRAKCSGRDAMCYEVLNDRWASHRSWASEDTEFVHHKKNQFEEAMFRSEEDRHEMDIEIDTNLSVIRQLTPIAQQIEQMDPEKQMQLTLPENFLSMSEALPRRVLRRVYDSGRALEIIKAMHTHPAVAIPIVLKRLKQKDEEWRRQRREFAKIWRETDERNYYRALDHQGLTFKSTDRKNTSPKQLITEIETRRREQQGLLADETGGSGSGGGGTAGGAQSESRRVASALRHRYQLEYQFSQPTVLADVVNAILAHVGRHNSQFAPSEKEMMERFFHDLFGGLFGIENTDQSLASATSDNGGCNSDDDDEEVAVKSASPATPAINGHAANDIVADTTGATADDVAAEEPAGAGAMEIDSKSDSAGPDAARELDEAGELGADGSGAAGDKPNGAAATPPAPAAATSPRTEEGSKPSTPGLISSRSWIQIGSAARDQSAAPSAAGAPTKSMSRAFYANSSYYVFLRLFQILYERFDRLRELGPEYQSQAIRANKAQSAATKLGLRPQLEVLKAYDLEHTEYYAIFLELVDQFLQGQLDAGVFEEAVRVMYGINAYRILTVDKVVQAIAKYIQSLVSDTRSIEILDLFTSLPAVHEQSPLRSHIAYRMKVEALVGADEHVFRVDYIFDSQTMTIQLLRREDITLDEAVTEEERWAYYVDSYVLFEPTEGVPQHQQSRPRPYLRRHLQADECNYAISSRSNLEIKIAVNTYKLCFLTGTEDIYANHTRRALLAADAAARAACDEQWDARATRWREWVERAHQQTAAAAAGDAGSGEPQLSEWWK